MSKTTYVSTPKELIDFLMKEKKRKKRLINELKKDLELLTKFIKIYNYKEKNDKFSKQNQ